MTHERDSWRDREVLGTDGQKIGTLAEVYLDTRTGQPDWASVNTGLFGMKSSFVPLHDATETADGIVVPFDKSHVKDAPNVDPDGSLTLEEEAALYAHYGLEHGPTGEGARLRMSEREFTAPRTREI